MMRRLVHLAPELKRTYSMERYISFVMMSIAMMVNANIFINAYRM